MNTFFITGLPRSRTCWLANLFTTGGQLCHHDLLGKVKSLPEFTRAMRGRGDSDSGLVYLFDELCEIFPQARWLLVERDAEESVASLMKVAAGTPWEAAARVYQDTVPVWLPQYLERRSQMLKESRVARIPFAELDVYETVAAAWRFLCPDTRLSKQRFELLSPMRVEAIPAKTPLFMAAGVIDEIRRQWKAHDGEPPAFRLPRVSFRVPTLWQLQRQ